MLLWEKVSYLGVGHPVWQIYEIEQIPIKIRERLAVWIEVNMLDTRNEPPLVIPLDHLSLQQLEEFGWGFNHQTEEVEVSRQEGQILDRLAFEDFLTNFHETGCSILYERLVRCLTHELLWVQQKPAPSFGSTNPEEISVTIERLERSASIWKKFTVLMHEVNQGRNNEANDAIQNELTLYEYRSLQYAGSLVKNLETLVNSLVNRGGYLYQMKWSASPIPETDPDAIDVNHQIVGGWFNRFFIVISSFEQTAAEILSPCPNHQNAGLELGHFLNRVRELQIRLLEHTLQIRRQPSQVLRKDVWQEFSSALVFVHPEIVFQVPHRMIVHVYILNEAQTAAWFQSRTQNATNLPDVSTFSQGHEIGFKPQKPGPQALHSYIHKLKIKRANRSRRNLNLQEKMCFVLSTRFVFQNRQIETWCCSNPFVYTVSYRQRTQAWATIFWDHYFRISDDRAPFLVPDTVPWCTLSMALSKYVKNTTKSTWGLTPTSLNYLKQKLWRRGINNEAISLQSLEYQLPSLRFERSPKFWEWFYFTTELIKNHLSSIWNQGLVVGFIDRSDLENILMQRFQPGSFALRFCEELVGGVSICYVTRNDQGANMAVSLEPFSASDLSVCSLGRIILDLNVLQRFVWLDHNENWREGPKLSIIPLMV